MYELAFISVLWSRRNVASCLRYPRLSCKVTKYPWEVLAISQISWMWLFVLVLVLSIWQGPARTCKALAEACKIVCHGWANWWMAKWHCKAVMQALTTSEMARPSLNVTRQEIEERVLLGHPLSPLNVQVVCYCLILPTPSWILQ